MANDADLLESFAISSLKLRNSLGNIGTEFSSAIRMPEGNAVNLEACVVDVFEIIQLRKAVVSVVICFKIKD